MSSNFWPSAVCAWQLLQMEMKFWAPVTPQKLPGHPRPAAHASISSTVSLRVIELLAICSLRLATASNGNEVLGTCDSSKASWPATCSARFNLKFCEPACHRTPGHQPALGICLQWNTMEMKFWPPVSPRKPPGHPRPAAHAYETKQVLVSLCVVESPIGIINLTRVWKTTNT